ncbi:hypothetical protein [Acinetobacter sp. ASP199]|uniref:hypothetical protein n=1 Tax=unclassified Acinetobacter TaxID=196816 RepID=UPI001F609F94|nr:hypothetical protein [Acinetobacter sp. ASP199]UNT59199.1 hypothetical protein IHE35_14220 [Acinetobacter sp. ASP199]
MKINKINKEFIFAFILFSINLFTFLKLIFISLTIPFLVKSIKKSYGFLFFFLGLFIYILISFIKGYMDVVDLIPFIFIVLCYALGLLNFFDSFKISFYSTIMLSSIAIISVFKDIILNGFVGGIRSIPFYFSDELVSATVMAGYLCLGFSFISLLFFNTKNKSIILLFVLFSLICAIRLGSRTLILIALFGFISTSVIIFIGRSKKQNKYNFLIMSTLIVLSLFFYKKISDILNYYFLDRIDNADASISGGGGRFEKWRLSLEKIYENPWGWEGEYYAHNFSLDIAKNVGILPVLFFLVWQILILSYIPKLIYSNLDTKYKIYFIFNILFGFFLLNFEPIFDGFLYFLALYCIIIGSISNLNYRK